MLDYLLTSFPTHLQAGVLALRMRRAVRPSCSHALLAAHMLYYRCVGCARPDGGHEGVVRSKVVTNLESKPAAGYATSVCGLKLLVYAALSY
jgi:hypothetical protein